MKEEFNYDPAVPVRQTTLRRISWPAVFGGLIITLAVQLLLTVLGISIGATVSNPMNQQNIAQGIGIAAGIWFIVVTVVSMFFGSWAAGRMSGLTRSAEGALNGLVIWGAATLLTVYLLSSTVGSVLSGTARLASAALPAASQPASAPNTEQGGIGSSLQDAANGSLNSIRQEAQNMIQNNAPGTAGANQKAQAEQSMRQAGQTAAKGVTVAGWWSFIVLLLGAFAAAWGGSRGTLTLLRSRSEAQAAV